MILRWTEQAASDLEEIHDHVALNHPDNALAWVKTLQARARDAAALPFAGREVPERRGQGIREVIEGNYRIAYRVLPEGGIEVLTVFEGHRLPRSI